MEMPKRKALIPYLICATVATLNIVGFILLLIGLHKRFAFFTVLSGGKMFFYSLMVLLPLVIGVCIVLIYRKISKRTKGALFALLATSVVISLIYIIAFSIMPPCGSETNRVEDYLVFDESCPAYYVSYSSLFPQQIPKSAENVKYFYRYNNYPDLHYDIFAQWTLPRDEYKTEKQRLVSAFPNAEIETSEGFNIAYVSDEKKSTLDHIVFAFNDKTFTLRYCVSYIEHVDINGFTPYYEDLTW